MSNGGTGETRAEADEQGQIYRDLLKFAHRLTGDAASAKDLVQGTFLQWYRHGEQLRDASRRKSWLCTTLHRRFLRDRQRDSRWVSLTESQISTLPCEPAPPHRILGDEGEVLRRAVALLPPSFRLSIELYYFRELSVQEVSEQLQVPVGTVLSRLHRARESLRRHLGDVGVRSVPQA